MAASDSCVVPRKWDLSLPENRHQLQAALYSGYDGILVTIVTVIGVIGVLANLRILYRLVRFHPDWDKLQCYLSCLATADGLFLLGALFFFIWAPFLEGSSVSFDVALENCWALFGHLILMQKLSTGFAIAIALEMYWLSYKNRPVFLANGSTKSPKSITITILSIVLVAFITLFKSEDVFLKSDEHCVRWPNEPQYENFPQTIRSCPTGGFASLPHIIFHDVPVIYIGSSIIVFCFWRVIQSNQKSDCTGDRDSVRRKIARCSNTDLKVVIFVYILCPVMALLHNIGIVTYRSLYPGADMPALPTTENGEFCLHFIRMFLMLQPATNTLIFHYFHCHNESTDSKVK